MIKKVDPTKEKCANCGKPTAKVDQLKLESLPDKIFCSEFCLDEHQGVLPPSKNFKPSELAKIVPKSMVPKTARVKKVTTKKKEAPAKPKKEKKEMGLAIQPDIAPATMNPKAMAEQMKVEAQKRKLIKEYINYHMVDGVDYGKIHIGKNCDNQYQCTKAFHFSKNTLFKPGSEKFVSLFKLRPMFEKDTDTLEMAGQEKGLFAYVCRLYTVKGDMVGEGRGAASLSEKTWLVNNAIKIAQKRAQVDAVLRTGALSDFFTQDLEDMDLSGGNGNIPQEAKDTELITEPQMKFVFVLLKKLDHDKEWLETQLNTSIENLTKKRATELIDQMNKSVEKQEGQAEGEKIIDVEGKESDVDTEKPTPQQIQF